VLSIFMAVFAGQDLFAQRLIGARIGMCIYQGDLIKEDFDIAQSYVGTGGFVEWHIVPQLAFQVSGNALRISGNDRKYEERSNPGRYKRAIKMDNLLLDISAKAVYYPFYKNSPKSGAMLDAGLQPYIGVGLALPLNFHQITDQNLDDGLQNFDAEQLFLAIPISFGYQVFFNNRFGVGLELQSTFTLNDESLDGYGHPGSANNDLYHFFSVNFVYNLGKSSKKT